MRPKQEMIGKTWRKYFSVIYWWQVKTGVITPLAITVVLGLVFLARPAARWVERRRKLPVPVSVGKG